MESDPSLSAPPAPWPLDFIPAGIPTAPAEKALERIAVVWESTSPTQSLRAILDSLPDQGAPLYHLLAISPATVEKLVRDPLTLPWLVEMTSTPYTNLLRRMKAHLHSLLAETPHFDKSFRQLRRFKAREALRIAFRDVGNLATVEETTRNLSDLAETCLQHVHDEWYQELAKRWGTPTSEFAVLGMGKFGGRELNYSSDIDLIFLYDEDNILKGNFTCYQFFTQLANRITATFSEASCDGALFRIDLRLRPEGGSGAIVRSLESMENYYAGFGETWERMALIKARGVCGSQELVYEFFQHLQTFIFPRTLSQEIFQEIARLKSRIEQEVVGSSRMTRHVKLGYGGIREIEFSIQALQLLNASKYAFLQEQNSLKTIAALSHLDLLTPQEAQDLTEAYRFLRKVEHRLQIPEEAQTHTIPESPDAQTILAASLGFPSLQAFSEKLSAVTSRVRQIFDSIVQTSSVARTPSLNLDFFDNSDQASRMLEELGGSNSANIHVAPRTRQVFEKLQPSLIEWLQKTPEPDAVLTRFVRFVEKYGIRGMLFESLVANPKLLELLIRLFDASPFLTEVVLRRPQLIEEVAREGNLGQNYSLSDYNLALQQNQEKLPPLEWIRVCRRAQILRILTRDVLSFANIDEIQAEYSALAQACLLFCQNELELNHLTIIAMGKFGGSELSYGSDLDIVFIGDSLQGADVFIKTMNSMTTEGIIFPVDTRLRPEGQSGILVIPFDAYLQYFNQRAQFWEAQSLTKARALSGPHQEEFLPQIQEIWRNFSSSCDVMHEVHSMHNRIVTQRSTGDDLRDFKTGRGGLMEVEFLAQALQMRAGIWENNTTLALTKLRDAGDLTADQCETLTQGYRKLRTTESILRRREITGVSSLPTDEASQSHLAQRLNFPSLQAFLDDFAQLRASLHKIYQSIFNL